MPGPREREESREVAKVRVRKGRGWEGKMGVGVGGRYGVKRGMRGAGKVSWSEGGTGVGGGREGILMTGEGVVGEV